MGAFKDEWDLKTKELYNEQGIVSYTAHLPNLSNTLAALLSQVTGQKLKVDLTQGNSTLKKMQINVTSIHQNKFRRTKLGHGFGYGTKDKLSPDEALFNEIKAYTNPEFRNRRRIPG